MSEYVDNETELNFIELHFDIIPIKKGEYFYLINDSMVFHINYVVERSYYERNKDKILNDICYKLEFVNVDKPKEIEKADVLIVVDRATSKIIRVIKQGLIPKEKLLELREIYDIGYLQYQIEKLIEEVDYE